MQVSRAVKAWCEVSKASLLTDSVLSPEKRYLLLNNFIYPRWLLNKTYFLFCQLFLIVTFCIKEVFATHARMFVSAGETRGLISA